MTVQQAAGKVGTAIGWRTPLVIVVCGCIISLLAFGPR